MFEEDFPSLKQELACYEGMDNDGLWIEDWRIQEHCLDKAKVLVAIKKIDKAILKNIHAEGLDCDISSLADPIIQAKKELGL